MAFDPLSGFFERFKNLTPPDESVRKKIVEIVSQKFGKEISISDVKVRNNIIYIQTQSTIKSELFMQKHTIIEEINSSLNKNIFDIR